MVYGVTSHRKDKLLVIYTSTSLSVVLKSIFNQNYIKKQIKLLKIIKQYLR